VKLTLDVLLDPSRAARMTRSGTPGFEAVTDGLLDASWFAAAAEGADASVQRQTSQLVLQRLMQLGSDPQAATGVRAIALDAVNRVDDWLDAQSPADRLQGAHYAFARQQIDRWRRDPAVFETLTPVTTPPGSPIGALTE
jgi:hypothetical protein